MDINFGSSSVYTEQKQNVDYAIDYMDNSLKFQQFKTAAEKFINNNKLSPLEANAFKHSYISAELAVEYGVLVSTVLGNSREITSFMFREVPTYLNDQNKTKFNNNMIDSSGDLYNNRIGYEVAKHVESGDITRDQILSVIGGALKSNQLVVDKSNDNRVGLFSFSDPKFDLKKSIDSVFPKSDINK